MGRGTRHANMPRVVGFRCNQLRPKPSLVEVHRQGRITHGRGLMDQGCNIKNVVLAGIHIDSISISRMVEFRRSLGRS